MMRTSETGADEPEVIFSPFFIKSLYLWEEICSSLPVALSLSPAILLREERG